MSYIIGRKKSNNNRGTNEGSNSTSGDNLTPGKALGMGHNHKSALSTPSKQSQITPTAFARLAEANNDYNVINAQ